MFQEGKCTQMSDENCSKHKHISQYFMYVFPICTYITWGVYHDIFLMYFRNDPESMLEEFGTNTLS